MMLFEMIRKLTPENQSSVVVISNLLGISIDAVYRRMRCETMLDFEELIVLCNHFGISLDHLINNTATNNIQCRYIPLDLRDMKRCSVYLQNMAASVESVRSAPDGEIIFTVVDIPICYYSAYKELSLFKLFSLNSSLYGFTGSYDDFVKDVDLNDLITGYEKVFKNYQQCPTTEIWAYYAFDRILSMLGYHHVLGHFSNKNFPLLLCEQLLDLNATMHRWAEQGTKGRKNTPYKFYVSEIDLCNTFVLFRKHGTINCDLKLFNINHFDIFDLQFCREIENWLNSAIQSSTLISGSSEIQRYQFFNRQRQKICALMDKILINSNGKG